MARPTTAPSGSALREVNIVLVIAGFLVLLQVILSWLYQGFGGKVHLLILYFITELIAYPFTSLGAEENYWVQVSLDILVMVGAMLTWHISGLILGITGEGGTKMKPMTPIEHFMTKEGNNNLVLKIALAYLAHVTLYSFWRFWVNLYHVLKSLWYEGGRDKRKL